MHEKLAAASSRNYDSTHSTLIRTASTVRGIDY
jgi:hypothetical protein